MATIEARLKALDKRLAQIERARLLRLYEPIAREFGMGADELLTECERFLALPLDVQLAEVDRLFDADPDADAREREAIKATLRDPTAAHADAIRLSRPAPRTPTPAPTPGPISLVPTPPPVRPAPPAPVIEADEDEEAKVDAELAEVLIQLHGRAGHDQTGIAQHLKNLISQRE